MEKREEIKNLFHLLDGILLLCRLQPRIKEYRPEKNKNKKKTKKKHEIWNRNNKKKNNDLIGDSVRKSPTRLSNFFNQILSGKRKCSCWLLLLLVVGY